MSPAEHEDYERIGRALEMFFDAPTWFESRRIAESNRELLTDEVDHFLGVLESAASDANDGDQAELIRRHRHLLRQVRAEKDPVARVSGEPELRRRAAALALRGEFEQAAADLARIAELRWEAGDFVEAGRAESACGTCLARAGLVAASLPHHARGAQLLDAYGPPDDRVAALAGWLEVLARVDQDDQAFALCDRIIDLTADHQGVEPFQEARTRALYHKAMLITLRRHDLTDAEQHEAATCAGEVLSILARDPTPDLGVEAQMRMVLGEAHLTEGHIGEAADEFARVLQIGQERGDEQLMEVALNELGSALEQVPEVGADRFRELAERYRASGDRYLEAMCVAQRAACLERVRSQPRSVKKSLERDKAVAEAAERAAVLFDRLDMAREAGDAYYRAGYALLKVSGFENDKRDACLAMLEAAAERFGAAEAWQGRGRAESAAAFVYFRHPRMPSGDVRSMEFLHLAARSFGRADRLADEAYCRLQIATQLGMRGLLDDEWLAAVGAWLVSHERGRAAMLFPHERETRDRQIAQMLMLLTGQLLDAAPALRRNDAWRAAVWGTTQAVKGRAFLDQQLQRDVWNHLLIADSDLRERTKAVEEARIRVETAERDVQSAFFSAGMGVVEPYVQAREAAQQELRDRERDQAERLRLITRGRSPAVRLIGGEPTTVADLQAALRPGELYLEYLGRYGRLIRASVTRNSYDVAIPELDQSVFTNWLRGMDERTRHGTGFTADDSESIRLAGLLVGDIPADIHTIVVCPHGELVRTPWHLLPLESGGAVGDAYVTAIVPAAGSFLQLRRDPPEPARSGYLGVSYDARDRPGLARLPGVDREVTQVAERYFRGADVDGRPNLITSAEADAFLGLTCRVRLLHVACHANRNGLQLARTVTPVDLLDLGVRADVVLLTGCDTGDFAADDANDFLGIVRQLMIATEARAVIASVTPVREAAGLAFSDLVVAALTGQTASTSGATPPKPLPVGEAVRWARRLREHYTSRISTDGESRSFPMWSPWFVIGDPAAFPT
ncbi:CHAT domain-containing protein [Streptosporangiaceae bacterium NEAU-GS5]|nr:CHAT domain-containing protein [Streptosporangiaceae bacterium NEAU-GS5]